MEKNNRNSRLLKIGPHSCEDLPFHAADLILISPERGKSWRIRKSNLINYKCGHSECSQRRFGGWWGAAEGADARVNATVQHRAASSAPPNQWWHTLSAFHLDLISSCRISGREELNWESDHTPSAQQWSSAPLERSSVSVRRHNVFGRTCLKLCHTASAFTHTFMTRCSNYQGQRRSQITGWFTVWGLHKTQGSKISTKRHKLQPAVIPISRHLCFQLPLMFREVRWKMSRSKIMKRLTSTRKLAGVDREPICG